MGTHVMVSRASGRLSLLIAAAVLFAATGTLRAEQDNGSEPVTESKAQTESAAPAAAPGKPVTLSKYTRQRRARHVSRRHKPGVVAKGYRRKTMEAKAVPMSEGDELAIPETIANANAQFADATLPAPAKPADNAVPADQLNEIDQATAPASDGNAVASQIATQVASQVVTNDAKTAPAMNAMASMDKPAVVENDNSSWGQASLFGKLFIAAGGLLMMASVARMMMA